MLKKLLTQRWTDYAWLAVALAILSALSLVTMTKGSIWFDEAFGAYLSHFSFFDIARFTAADVHPPLFYWLLKLWEMVFGYDSLLAVRGFSLFFAGVAVIFAWLIVRRLFGRKAAALSLLLIVLSPMVIRYAQEARMYMLEAAIVFAGTYLLILAKQSKRWLWWILYGIVVSLGMWTHYFTALAWLAHWAWHLYTVWPKKVGGKGWLKLLARNFFTKQWLVAYGIAVALYLPWLPFMAFQLFVVQSYGFWIPPVGIDTPANYVSNIFYYLEHNQVTSWFAVALVGMVTILAITSWRVYRTFDVSRKKSYALLLCLALVPVGLLIVASLPPLASSFVERYLVPSVIALLMVFAVAITYGLRSKKWRQIGIIVLILALFVYGISNVYMYGNFNKNTNTNVRTGQVIEQIHELAEPGEPIVASSPWIFYEAVFYSTSDHPVYFIDADTEYRYGSLEMLRQSDNHKILDADAFFAEHETVWYIGDTTADSVTSSRTDGWTALQTVGVHDEIKDVTRFKATEYRTSAE